MMPTVDVNPSSTARFADLHGVVRIVNAAAHHRVDVDVKFGVLGEQLQLLVENL